MDAFSRDDLDPIAARTTNVLAHLEGALDEEMLAAMQGVWSMLEHAAVDSPAHARAVRARLFWESLAPGGVAAAPVAVVTGLVASWDEEPLDDAAVDERQLDLDLELDADAA